MSISEDEVEGLLAQGVGEAEAPSSGNSHSKQRKKREDRNSPDTTRVPQATRYNRRRPEKKRGREEQRSCREERRILGQKRTKSSNSTRRQEVFLHRTPREQEKAQPEINSFSFRGCRDTGVARGDRCHPKPRRGQLQRDSRLEENATVVVKHRRSQGQPCLYCGDALKHTLAVNIFLPGDTLVNGQWKLNSPQARRNSRKFFVCAHFLVDLVSNTRTNVSKIHIRTAGSAFVEYSLCGDRQNNYGDLFKRRIRRGASTSDIT